MQAVAPRPAGFCGTPTRNIPKAALEKLAAVDKANAENVPAAPVPVFTGKSPSTGKKQAATTESTKRTNAKEEEEEEVGQIEEAWRRRGEASALVCNRRRPTALPPPPPPLKFSFWPMGGLEMLEKNRSM